MSNTPKSLSAKNSEFKLLLEELESQARERATELHKLNSNLNDDALSKKITIFQDYIRSAVYGITNNHPFEEKFKTLNSQKQNEIIIKIDEIYNVFTLNRSFNRSFSWLPI